MLLANESLPLGEAASSDIDKYDPISREPPFPSRLIHHVLLTSIL